jgi:hypothetical protein
MRLFPYGTRFLVFCEANDRQTIQSMLVKEMTASEYGRLVWDVSMLETIPDDQQFLRMAACTMGGIIANSTFSVWAAYVHDALQPIRTSCNSIFVVPKQFLAHEGATQWGKEIQDPRWVRMSNQKPVPPGNDPPTMTTRDAWVHLQTNKSPLLMLLSKIHRAFIRKEKSKEECIQLLHKLRRFTIAEETAWKELVILVSHC